MRPVTIESSAIDITADEVTAFQIARKLADEVCGEFEVEYVKNQDPGEYGTGNPGPFKADFHDNDFEYYADAYGASAAEALLTACKKYLRRREMEPKWLEEDQRMIDDISGDQARATLKAILAMTRTPPSLRDALRKHAGLTVRTHEE